MALHLFQFRLSANKRATTAQNSRSKQSTLLYHTSSIADQAIRPQIGTLVLLIEDKVTITQNVSISSTGKKKRIPCGTSTGAVLQLPHKRVILGVIRRDPAGLSARPGSHLLSPNAIPGDGLPRRLAFVAVDVPRLAGSRAAQPRRRVPEACRIWGCASSPDPQPWGPRRLAVEKEGRRGERRTDKRPTKSSRAGCRALTLEHVALGAATLGRHEAPPPFVYIACGNG
ncbi:hypothetical protein EJB05_48229 [Eragrostis curvula]|uniref:Uncharacterized protein n=1 Tax=Eragrostis curvula TaxID=38414 RepID=A0A5J9T2G2_9POAL|nr:hypothetical protein EJB05_48229 [Eragrostis curvula]